MTKKKQTWTRMGQRRKSADSRAGIVFPGTGETRLIHTLLTSHVSYRHCRETPRHACRGSDRPGHDTCGNIFLEGLSNYVQRKASARLEEFPGQLWSFWELKAGLDLLVPGSKG